MQMVLVITDEPSLFIDDSYKLIMGRNTKLHEKPAYVCVHVFAYICVCTAACMLVETAHSF